MRARDADGDRHLEALRARALGDEDVTVRIAAGAASLDAPDVTIQVVAGIQTFPLLRSVSNRSTPRCSADGGHFSTTRCERPIRLRARIAPTLVDGLGDSVIGAG